MRAVAAGTHRATTRHPPSQSQSRLTLIELYRLHAILRLCGVRGCRLVLVYPVPYIHRPPPGAPASSLSQARGANRFFLNRKYSAAASVWCQLSVTVCARRSPSAQLKPYSPTRAVERNGAPTPHDNTQNTRDGGGGAGSSAGSRPCETHSAVRVHVPSSQTRSRGHFRARARWADRKGAQVALALVTRLRKSRRFANCERNPLRGRARSMARSH